LLKFTKLRLAGFKSFVDATEIPIELGLTGVVGPNGCGKSNLVEALRWVMGETSAKQMRGGEMDDVIFGGSAGRPARNIAEVVLALDNGDRSAPAVFNEFESIEVSRRIEREGGSVYRVNGKDVRARDVQLLFADSATGARSPALVSQGRVGAVINAKPQERRLLLEEAAGIIGLHSRRHEAELRLRGAETNLQRLEDVLGTLEVQLQNLKKQVRQASRYRNLNEHIRRAEANLYFLRWSAAERDLEASRAAMAAAAERVTELTRRAAERARLQAERAAALPGLRRAEAAAAAELQRLLIARDGLEQEEQRIAASRRECGSRLDELAADVARERALAADAGATIARLGEERAGLEAARERETQAQAESAAALAAAGSRVADLEARHAELFERLTAAEARRAALASQLAELRARDERLAARAEEVDAQLRGLAAEAPAPESLDPLAAQAADAQGGLQRARELLNASEGARADAERALAEALAAREEAERALAALAAEERTLKDVIEPLEPGMWPPMIDAVAVEPGFEGALAAALGDDLAAPADEPAPAHWRTLAPFPFLAPLPPGARPLSQFVRAPAALQRRLRQVGVVEDDGAGRVMQERLAQGQRLVSRAGALWRWDGYAASAAATAGAVQRLAKRSRLKELGALLPGARAALAEARAAAAAAESRQERAAAAEREARDRAQAAADAHAMARDALARHHQQASLHASRRQALEGTAASLAGDRAEAASLARQAEGELARLPDAEHLMGERERARAELAEGRRRFSELQADDSSLVRAAEERTRRLDELASDLEAEARQQASAEARLAELTQRERGVRAELARLDAMPAAVAERRSAVLALIETADAARKAAADRLAAAESALAEADRGARQAESELAEAREDRVRQEGAIERGEEALARLAERVAERLSCRPGQLRELAGLDEGDEAPDPEAVERRLERLLRERETMGPVNLRAEQEANELAEQTSGLETERADLVRAIEKLRQGIGQLNREGRERLLASFQEVDRHFQALFVRLFGGGRAHLELVEAEDPLESGLEIMASPPGKRLQVLSLLSGGEQALTALALLFAVFMTNPAPICVLDEVDAPLDDANVDRFCTLLGEMAEGGRTRFLVITHHRITMARVDRLLGVTMAERGVSQVVSVDLQRAEELRATA
jgi:chromosome segregation protein